MDAVGEYTLQIMKLAGWYNNWLFSKIEKNLGKEILEVGAGIGNFTELLSTGGNVTAVDFNLSYVNGLKRKLPRINSGFGDVEKGKFFFKNKKFDTIICFNVLEHIKDDRRGLKNMFRLLKPNGNLILLVPAHQFLFSSLDRNLGHFRRYNKVDMDNKLKETGFKKIESKYLNWWAAIGWLVFLKLTTWERMPKNEVGIFNRLGRYLLWPERFVSPPFGLSVIAVAQK